MTHTAHGHWIAGTPHTPWNGPVQRCGGPGVCTLCSREFARAPKSTTCLDHATKQHRDARPPWCKNCGLSSRMAIPWSRFEEDKKEYLHNLAKENPLDPNTPVVPAKDADENFQEKARRLVVEHANKRMHRSDDFHLDFEQTYIVWFCYILGNWKALISTQLPDQMYYEVTHDRDRQVAFVDSYKKWENSEYPDDPPVHGNKEDGIEPTPAGVGG